MWKNHKIELKEVYVKYPYLLSIEKKPKFQLNKDGSVDFSTESFFNLYSDFAAMYGVLLYAVTVCLKSGLCKNYHKNANHYCFLNDNVVANFYSISDDLTRYITYYNNTDIDFNKKIYLSKIKVLFYKLIPVFNLLSEYIGSFSNTFLYRNIVIKKRVLSIIDPSFNPDLEILIKHVHRIIAGFFNKYYSALLSHYDLSDHIYGFVEKKSCADNAFYHLANNPESLVNMDVNKFFNNCTIIKLINSQVFKKTLSLFDIPESIITSFYFGIISLFSYLTHNSVFPTGASYTPVLSNLIFLNIDIEIKNYINSLNKKYNGNVNILYSRYADDITLSSNVQKINNTNTLNISVIKDIEKILNQYGFFLKYEKTKIFLKGDSKVVNGLILDIPNGKLSIGTDLKYNLKNIFRSNPDILQKDRKYAGYISYVKGVSKEQYNYITGKK